MAAQLIALPPVERLSPRVIRVLGGNPGKFTLQGTNTYLLGTGRQRILIDTGEGRPAWLASLKETLERENAVVESALISHWHHDHVNGIKDLRILSPDTRFYKHNPDDGQSAIEEGQTFQVEGVTLTASHTPGHTTDHMAFVLAEEDAMFTADNVLGQGTAVFEDIGSYLASLHKMQKLFGGRAYPGHGPVLEDGPAKIAEYIAHRRQREDQVLRTLRSKTGGNLGAWTPLEVVKVVYADVREELHQAAAGGVIQILEKLEKEGIVEREQDERWRLKIDNASL
jgi:endoribonuclease LACTB2